MKKKNILILEDNEDFRESLKIEFEEKGLIVTAIEKICDIPKIKNLFDYGIIDLRLKLDNGIHAIELLQAFNPNCKIVMLTGYPSLATAVKAIKKGAINYLTKPINIKQLEDVLFEEDASDKISPQQTSFMAPPLSLAKHEREYIEYILSECEGNITNAAKRLGLHRQSLQRKLKKYPPKK